jgi:hypothetical protein
MADAPIPGFREYWRQKLASLNFERHAVIKKYPEAASVVQLSDIENLAGCTPAKVGENSERVSIVNSAEDSRKNLCKALHGQLLFRALYGMYAVTLNELEAVLKMTA